MLRCQINATRWLAAQLRAYDPKTFTDQHLYRFFPREGDGPRVSTPKMQEDILAAGAVIGFTRDESPNPILEACLRQLLLDDKKKIKVLQVLEALEVGKPEMWRADRSSYLGISVFYRIQTEIERPDVQTKGLTVMQAVANALDRRADRHEKAIGKPRGAYKKPLTAKEREAHDLFDKGYSGADAAEKLNISVEAYRKRLRNAKKKLKSCA